MDDPFCPPLAEEVAREAASLPELQFRRIHPQADQVVLNRWLAGNGFESLATSRMLEAYGRQTGLPVITGDCVSPVLARVCEMHLAYYHIVSNWSTGLTSDDPTIVLDEMYTRQIPRAAARLELSLLDRLEEPADCRCRVLLRQRPAAYTLALSPAPEPS
jgi:hypothetical protein